MQSVFDITLRSKSSDPVALCAELAERIRGSTGVTRVEGGVRGAGPFLEMKVSVEASHPRQVQALHKEIMQLLKSHAGVIITSMGYDLNQMYDEGH